MPWIIGLDEAGYGPNLGPLVMTAVGCLVPDAPRLPDCWHLLCQAVRRHDDPDDGRILVADSKLVYSSTQGLAALERGVASILPHRPGTLHDLVELLVPHAIPHLQLECWYHGASALPVEAGPEWCQASAQHFQEACQRQGVRFGILRSVVVPPAAFNATVERWGSKGAVLGLAMVELLRHTCAADTANHPVAFYIDKHGGRNHYAALVQSAFDDAMVVARSEGALQSVYEVIGRPRTIEVTFEPRADMSHFCVALASMVSKYLRELFMREFNQFWQQKVPGLKPTAGYPGDARRFWNEIAGVVRELGIREEVLWRCR
jgi:ribonuclease HII